MGILRATEQKHYKNIEKHTLKILDVCYIYAIITLEKCDKTDIFTLEKCNKTDIFTLEKYNKTNIFTLEKCILFTFYA